MMSISLREQLLAESDRSERVQILFDYLTQHGDEHYEEDVTQMQHALQAAWLGRSAGQDAHLVTAALLHDIGHIIADDPEHRNNPTVQNDKHETLAAACLEGIFPHRVLEPIQLHVVSKRYLCTVRPAYYQNLSEASQKSFHLQGGKMSEEEQRAFRAHPYYQQALLLRTWDDQAKDITLEVPALETYTATVQDAML